MKKCFSTLVNRLGKFANAIIFVGDMFDSGRCLEDEDFRTEFLRFEKIFETNLKKIFIPGNHDVGYGNLEEKILERYEKYFGKLNFLDSVGPIDVLGINAVYLESTTNENARDNVWKLIDEYVSKKRTNPMMLLSHVPLWRPNNDLCKFQRTRGLREGEGEGYKNMLPRSISKALLKKIKPFRIFSGDDHQHCEHKHAGSGVVENTIGTFSWLQGEKHPSFGMFSVVTEPSSHQLLSSEFQVCYLPPQEYLYKWYAVFFVISIIPLLLLPMFITVKDGILFWRNDKKEPADLEAGEGGAREDSGGGKRVVMFLGKLLLRGAKPTLSSAAVGLLIYFITIMYWWYL